MRLSPKKLSHQDGDKRTRMVTPTERETMRRILLTVISCIHLGGHLAKADIQVIQVRRNIPLSDDEPVYKDYYLSAGKKAGLRVNLVLPVWRWVNLRENSQAQDQSMKIMEPIGWLKVIFVQDQLSVARLYQSADYEKGPVFDQPGIMIGDIVSLQNSYMAKPGMAPPKDSAQQQELKVSMEIFPAQQPTVAIDANKAPAISSAIPAENPINTAKDERNLKLTPDPASVINPGPGPRPASVE